MNVLVSCDYQNGSAAGAGKSLAMCFGAIVALSKVLKSVSGVTSLSCRWLPETLREYASLTSPRHVPSL